jgi:hypothetical protein
VLQCSLFRGRNHGRPLYSIWTQEEDASHDMGDFDLLSAADKHMPPPCKHLGIRRGVLLVKLSGICFEQKRRRRNMLTFPLVLEFRRKVV